MINPVKSFLTHGPLNLPMSKVESREKTCLFVICFSLFVEPITSQLNSSIRSITSFNLKIPL